MAAGVRHRTAAGRGLLPLRRRRFRMVDFPGTRLASGMEGKLVEFRRMKYPDEHHHREQYFFDQKTLAELADFAAAFECPCCLCAPMLGRELHRRGRQVRVLDVDRRFADLSGFVEWDLYRPRHLEGEFDLIVCDPPFFNVSLSQLSTAIRLLCHFDLSRKVMVSYPVRRSRAIVELSRRLDCGGAVSAGVFDGAGV